MFWLQSGRLNSWDQLNQLCSNAVFRLQLTVSPSDMDDLLVVVRQENPRGISWDLPTFTKWFKDSFNSQIAAGKAVGTLVN